MAKTTGDHGPEPIDTPPTPKPAVTDHKPRLNQRLADFLASFETKLGAERYRAMLSILAVFADMSSKAQLAEDHETNALWLAGELKKVLISEHDIVQVLSKMIRTEDILKSNSADKTAIGDLTATLLNRVVHQLGQSVDADLEGIDAAAQFKNAQVARDKRRP